MVDTAGCAACRPGTAPHDLGPRAFGLRNYTWEESRWWSGHSLSPEWDKLGGGRTGTPPPHRPGRHVR